MLHRLREAWDESGLEAMIGPIEADETYVGGKLKNMTDKRRKEMRQKADLGKSIVAGVKDRTTGKVSARSVADADKTSLQGFVGEHTVPGAALYTDEARAYQGMPNHETVCHSAGEHVRGDVHVQGIESFWSMFKRGYHGTYHHMSAKHLDRYVSEFAGRHNVRDADTIDQMETLVTDMIGKRLSYQMLIGGRA